MNRKDNGLEFIGKTHSDLVGQSSQSVAPCGVRGALSKC